MHIIIAALLLVAYCIVNMDTLALNVKRLTATAETKITQHEFSDRAEKTLREMGITPRPLGDKL